MDLKEKEKKRKKRTNSLLKVGRSYRQVFLEMFNIGKLTGIKNYTCVSSILKWQLVVVVSCIVV